MKALFCLFLAAVTTGLASENPMPTYAAFGRLIVTQFVSAPFPHPARAEGHNYKDKFFSADKHYSDRTVAIFIPRGFRAGDKVDFVVHFHGWGNHVSSVLAQFQLIEQLAESRRNAVLVVPQGPRDASDSFGGKLEDPDGFKRFMEETMATLRREHVIRNSQVGNIILSGHSGGYHVMAFILAQGGLTARVREVWLFDALYGETEKFTNWFGRQPGRLLDIYTEHGGTKGETEKLMADLKAKGTPFCAKKELEVTSRDLQKNQRIFLYTELSHNDVLARHKSFYQFLKTSCLGEIKAR